MTGHKSHQQCECVQYGMLFKLHVDTGVLCIFSRLLGLMKAASSLLAICILWKLAKFVLSQSGWHVQRHVYIRLSLD